MPPPPLKALIVKVKITKLGQSEKDDELTAEIHNLHGMGDEAGRYTKALYPPGAFKEITSVEGKVRRYHKNQQGKRLILSSLGWICPGPYVEDYHAKIRDLENEFYPAVDRVKEKWPEILAECRRVQADHYDDDDYPPQERIREHFGFRLTMSPMPRTTDIGDLDFLCAERIDEIRSQVQSDVSRAAHDGAQQAMSRVLSLVGRISARLSQPDPTVHDKLIEDLREMCDLAPGLNLANDPEVSQLIFACRAKLLTVSPETLRDSALQRRLVAGAARNIASNFGTVGSRKLAA
ncbi:MAG: hypothetical protein QOE70_4007 [Chthoniobacter sp.]|jgi:hypothetical protein|nr:hypothetical protein [Chthoniobacter sp.]